MAHDWSELSYPSKTTRQDLAELSSSGDFGYELTCALAINPDDGLPMAPLEMHLKTSTGLLSTRGNVQETGHIDQVLATMQASANWNLPRPIVHVIDREVDSVGHFREWDAAGQKFLVCADDRQVLYQGQKVKLSDIREQFVEQDKFKPAGTVVCDNRPGKLEIAEVEVTLDRPDRKFVKKVRGDVLDEPLPLRLVLTRVLEDQQDVSAQWYLLSNVPTEWADSKRLADSYLQRSQIETYFKLMKSHGMQVEHWLQETAAPLFRRLLIASAAMVEVWHPMAPYGI